MEGASVTIYKNCVKVFETSSKASLLESIREIKEKTNKALTEIVENTSNGTKEAEGKKGSGNDSGDVAEESDDEEEGDGDPLSKKIKLTT